MFWDNLLRLCEEHETTPFAVCEAIGLSNSASVRWKKGSVPQAGTLQKIANYFGVTRQDLLREVIEPSVNLKEELRTKMVPVYESVSAGFGTMARNEAVDFVPCVIRSYEEAAETIGIVVHGDSMYPKIENGDTIIVHKQTSVDSGTLAVVMVDGDEGYVKRVEYGADWIHLISINPMYPIMKFKGEDVLRVQVVGRVTRIIKDV